MKRAVELHFSGSTLHTPRTGACAHSALIALSSSPAFDPVANSVAQAFESCTVWEGSLLQSLSELRAGATFLFFFFRICFAAQTQSCSLKRGSDSSVSLLSGAIFRFFKEAPLPALAIFFGFLSPEPWAFVGSASGFELFPFGARSSFWVDSNRDLRTT